MTKISLCLMALLVLATPAWAQESHKAPTGKISVYYRTLYLDYMSNPLASAHDMLPVSSGLFFPLGVEVQGEVQPTKPLLLEVSFAKMALAQSTIDLGTSDQASELFFNISAGARIPLGRDLWLSALGGYFYRDVILFFNTTYDEVGISQNGLHGLAITARASALLRPWLLLEGDATLLVPLYGSENIEVTPAAWALGSVSLSFCVARPLWLGVLARGGYEYGTVTSTEQDVSLRSWRMELGLGLEMEL